MKNRFQITSKWNWIYGIYASIGLVGFIVMFFAIFSKEATTFQQVCGFPFISLSCFFFGTQSVYGYFQSITTTPNKIYYRTFGFNVEIDWQNVKRIGKYKNFIWKYDGLYLKKSDGKANIWFPGTWFEESQVFIPLSLFSDNWRDSELGQQIKQYAPHLFQ